MSVFDDLHRLIDGLSEELAGEVLDFAEYLAAKRGIKANAGGAVVGPEREDQAWLESGLLDAAAGIAAVEAEVPSEQVSDWLRTLDEGARPVKWDDDRGEFVEVAG